jgi:hypothetical protein
MINLSLLHKLNHTGEQLLDEMQDRFGEVVTSRITDIDGSPYIYISFKEIEKAPKRILNSLQPIRNSINPEVTSSILKLSNIIYGNRNSDMIVKKYDVLVFDMSVISVRQKIISGPKSDKYIRESESPRVCELAKKTVYLLGLDYAMVTILVTGKRKLKVLSIDSSPVIRKKDLTSLVSKIELLYKSNPPGELKPVMLGADPEFMLLNAKSGKIVAASDFFPRDGLVGCDNIRIPNRQQRPVAEIRPRPDLSPHNLIDNIRHALNTAIRMAPYRNLKWVAGSQPSGSYSIGGHIHFSNIDLNNNLLRALENYLAIPVFLIENPVSAARRRKKYGLLADVRFKQYGGFEYRTPGSWLVSPQIALAILCLAKVVATHYMELTDNYLDNYEAQAAFYRGDQDYFRPIFNRLWTKISATETYRQYSAELKLLSAMISDGNIWDEKHDFREVWQISRITRRKHVKSNNSSSTAQKTSRRPPTSIQSRSITADIPLRNNLRNSTASNTVRDISPGQAAAGYLEHLTGHTYLT